MSALPLLRKSLRDLRGTILGYGGGLAVLVVMYLALFPTFRETLSSIELPEGFSAFFGDLEDMSSLRTFVQLEFFSVWMPLLLAVYAITAGTSQIAGDEERGRLEVVLAQPVTRTRLMLERAAALLVGAFAIIATVAVALFVGALALSGEDLSPVRALTAPFAMLGFGAVLIALALLFGAVAPRRGQATALLTLLTVGFYVFDVLRDFVDALEPLRFVSPFFYANTKAVLTAGVEPWHQAVLYISTLVLLVLALRAFEARDIGTGRSPLGRWWPALPSLPRLRGRTGDRTEVATGSR